MSNKIENYIFKASCDAVEPICKIVVSQTQVKAFTETICASVKGTCYLMADLAYPIIEDSIDLAGANLPINNIEEV